MPGWVLWVLAAAAFGIGELLTTSFFFAPFALGAVLAAVVDVAGAGGLPAWIVFVVASLLALGAGRPIARSRRRMAEQARARQAALIGKQAIVLERIVNHEGVGCVRIHGEVWTARSLDGGQVIEKGTLVEVVEIRGATALVIE